MWKAKSEPVNRYDISATNAANERRSCCRGVRTAGGRHLSVQPLRRARAPSRLLALIARNHAGLFGSSGDQEGRPEPRVVHPVIAGRPAPTHFPRYLPSWAGCALADDRLCSRARQCRSCRVSVNRVCLHAARRLPSVPTVLLCAVSDRWAVQILSACVATPSCPRTAAARDLAATILGLILISCGTNSFAVPSCHGRSFCKRRAALADRHLLLGRSRADLVVGDCWALAIVISYLRWIILVKGNLAELRIANADSADSTQIDAEAPNSGVAERTRPSALRVIRLRVSSIARPFS